jgi:stage II sporulation protein AA (anti-sigma F factor antagonist)
VSCDSGYGAFLILFPVRKEMEGGIDLKVLSSYQDGRLTLFLKGELDHHEAAAALRKIMRTLDDYLPQDCVVDMGSLTFMDSSGIALILKISRLMDQTGGRAWVENAKGQPLKVIDASGIDRLIKIS